MTVLEGARVKLRPASPDDAELASPWARKPTSLGCSEWVSRTRSQWRERLPSDGLKASQEILTLGWSKSKDA